jgi:hypothetical protein
MGNGTYALVYATLISGVSCDGSGTFLVPCVDEDTGGLVSISHYEADVHQSRRFKASYLQPHGGELADDATHDFLVKVGALGAHATFGIAVGGNCELLIYGGTTVSADGAALASISKNREDVGTAQTIVYDTPTVTGVGTLLLTQYVPGGTRGTAAGGGWSEPEWILAPDTNYLIRITNRAGGSGIQLSISLEWSEH